MPPDLRLCGLASAGVKSSRRFFHLHFLKFANCFVLDFAILHVIYYKEIGRIAFS